MSQGTFNIINLEEKGLHANRSFALDILNGLSDKPKTIPSQYLYDERGSLLFEKITELPEYYPTNCELEILNKRKHDIRNFASNDPFRLIELGVGDARKTKVLLQHFLEHNLEFEYVLVDCCKEMVNQTVASLKQQYRDHPIRVTGIVAEYSTALSWINTENHVKNIVLFLGSSIGNFDQEKTSHFLHQMWDSLCDGDCVFIGFDLIKDIDILERAYNDAAGLTKEFNLNLLDRLNRELDANFIRNQYIHHSFYNPSEKRMESWIVSTTSQTVNIGKLQKAFEFDPWEGIHVENSYKYNLKGLKELAHKMGFEVDGELIDSKRYFADAIWHVKKMHASLGV